MRGMADNDVPETFIPLWLDPATPSAEDAARGNERVVPIPYLTAEEIQVLLHGLDRLVPGLDLRRHLDTFDSVETWTHAQALSTALLEALTNARR